jgi:hypothetical protein
LLKILSLGDGLDQEFRKYVKRHPKVTSLGLVQAIAMKTGRDVLVAYEGGEIVGLCALLRVTTGTAAIVGFRVPRNDSRASDLLLGEAVRRARETLHRHVTCIPGHDRLPSDMMLAKAGFSHWFNRELFNCQLLSVQRTSAVTVSGQSQVLEILNAIPPREPINMNFRAVPVSLESIGALLNGGVLLALGGAAEGLASVFVSKAAQSGDSHLTLIPEYLAGTAMTDLTSIGEVTLLSTGDPAVLLGAASAWLAEKGIGSMNVYFRENRELGVRIAAAGFRYVGLHDIWYQELKGPMDQFLA